MEEKNTAEIQPEETVAATATESETKPKTEKVVEAKPVVPYKAVDVTLDALLAAGAHFGHKVERWNPRMLPFIFGKKGGVHVINLDITLDYWQKTAPKIKAAAAQGKTFLFVGTKEQAGDVVKSAAERCGAFYINYRWLGGALTNFQTMKRSISKMDALEQLLKKADDEKSEVRLGKKEKLQITRKLEKLSVNLGGIRKMRRIPDYIFIVDINRDAIAVQEARKLHVPVIALVDTNSDPTFVDWPIPTNDDSRRAIELFVNAVSDQVAAGVKEASKQAAAAKKAKQVKKKPVVAKAPAVEHASPS